MKRFTRIFTSAALLFAAVPVLAQEAGWKSRDVLLRDHWYIQSSAVVPASGSMISTGQYHPSHWYPTTIPHTVLATLVDDSIYRNIFFSNNLEKISDTPFDHPWWYRTSFQLGPEVKGRQVRIRFNGINYRADVWLNGHLVAGADSVAGSFRMFTLDVTPYVKPGENILAVEVTRPVGGELAIGFVDWNPEPADQDMGIWRNVHLLVTGPVSIEDPFVETQVDSATLAKAWLTLSATLQNHSGKVVQGDLVAAIGTTIRISKPITLEAGESQKILLDPSAYPQLVVDHPRLWWTNEMGRPNLYPLHLEFRVHQEISDQKQFRFGIRTITGYRTPEGFRAYRLNGKNILIKGGGWTDPMLLNASSRYEEAGIDYAVQMHLNAIRMEGFWGHDQHIFDLCDEKGILVMAGFSCQWEWPEHMGGKADQYGGI
ncbi:MAG TPA: hypothetical protein VMV20_07165, partial [Chitinophagaceae bacterium]|nr:hypothetical protein [Chitinophagaceae bacterium]